jgi:hypothetical protein
MAVDAARGTPCLLLSTRGGRICRELNPSMQRQRHAGDDTRAGVQQAAASITCGALAVARRGLDLFGSAFLGRVHCLTAASARHKPVRRSLRCHHHALLMSSSAPKSKLPEWLQIRKCEVLPAASHMR